jgi:PmbA protein
LNEKILELHNESKKKFDLSEIYSFNRKELLIKFSNREVVNICERQFSQDSLRIVNNNQIGYATTSGKMDIKKLLCNASETSKFGEKSFINLDCYSDIPKVETHSNSLEGLVIKDLIETSMEIMAKINSVFDNSLTFICCISIIYDEINLINFLEKLCQYKKTVYSFNIEGNYSKNNNFSFISYKNAKCSIPDIYEIIENIKQQIEVDYDETCKLDCINNIILTPHAVYNIFRNIIAMNFNGKKASIGVFNSTSFSKLINIYDDGTYDFLPNSQPFDDEGIPSRRTALVYEGKVQNYIYDMRTAYALGKNSTGNGKRGWGMPPSPIPNSIILNSNNPNSYKNVVNSINKGVVIDLVRDTGKSRYNDGYFSGYILRGYYIQKGEIISGIRSGKIELNFCDVFNNIINVCDDSTWVCGVMNTPSLHISNKFISLW